MRKSNDSVYVIIHLHSRGKNEIHPFQSKDQCSKHGYLKVQNYKKGNHSKYRDRHLQKK